MAASLVLVLASSSLATPPLSPPGVCGAFSRPWDVVILEGQAVLPLLGHRVEELSLVAADGNGRSRAIPFQVERKMTLVARGRIRTADRLVFSACDVGAAHSAAAPLATIVVADPHGRREGFVYVMKRAGSVPPDRYVSYDADEDRVTSAAYQLRFERGLPVDLHLGGEDLLDHFRIALEGTLLGGVGTWAVDESDVRTRRTAFISGPVRVTRRMRHRIPLLFGIPSPGSNARTHFTARGVTVPGKFTLPVSAGLLFRSLGGYAGAVLRSHAGGTWRVAAASDSVAGAPLETQGDGGGGGPAAVSLPWFVLETSGTAMLFGLELDKGLQDPLRLSLERPVPGGAAPAVGFRMAGGERIPRGRHRFALRVVFLPDYRVGDEQAVLATLGQPLRARVVAGAAGDLAGLTGSAVLIPGRTLSSALRTPEAPEMRWQGGVGGTSAIQ